MVEPSIKSNDSERHSASESKSKRKRRRRRERVAVVFQDDASQGPIMVHALLKSGSRVAAITQSLNANNVTDLLSQKRVTVKIFDTVDLIQLSKAIRGADRAILVTKYWERFEDSEEEFQAMTLIEACHVVGIYQLTFITLEDSQQLRHQGESSQIAENEDGEIKPTFDAMKPSKKKAASFGIHLSHMIISYVGTEVSKTSLCLISGEDGKLIVTPFVDDKRIIEEPPGSPRKPRSMEEESLRSFVSKELALAPDAPQDMSHDDNEEDASKSQSIRPAVSYGLVILSLLVCFDAVYSLQDWLDRYCEAKCKSDDGFVSAAEFVSSQVGKGFQHHERPGGFFF